MNTQEIRTALIESSYKLPDCAEAVVLHVMIGNLYAGVSNRPMADHARGVARQMLADLKPTNQGKR